MNMVLIGSLPPPVGGTTVLFKQLVDELAACPDITLQVIDTSRTRSTPVSNLFTACKSLLSMLRHIPFTDVVSFHTSVGGAWQFGLVVHLLCRAFRRKWIFRGFGGDYDVWHQQASPISRRIFEATVLRADTLLFERQASVHYFRQRTEQPVEWYANSRKCTSTIPAPSSRARDRAERFVYVGHVKHEKGIGEIIEAARLLDEGLTIDIYGPLSADIGPETLTGKNLCYKGVLAPEAVVPTLGQYDVLLLPTYWKGEGYPGVILEAYCAGLPVITTRWGGIPEIVSERSGILIEPRNSLALADAMRTLTHSSVRMSALRNGAALMAQQFSSRIWTQTFLDLSRRLLDR